MPIKLLAVRPKKFQLIDPTRTRYNVRRGIKNYLEGVARQMAEYPPKANPAGYQRTYRLRQGWLQPGSIHMSADGTSGELINPVLYAVYVQGPRGKPKGQRQAAFLRRLGWKSISDVARETAPRYKQIMNRALKGSPG